MSDTHIPRCPACQSEISDVVNTLWGRLADLQDALRGESGHGLLTDLPDDLETLSGLDIPKNWVPVLRNYAARLRQAVTAERGATP